jgi:hypothetical protein
MWETDSQVEPITCIGPMGQRKGPWLIDVLLYPVTATGIVNLCVFVGLPMLMIKLVLIKHFVRIVGLYMIWYYVQCIRTSAGGGLRAPAMRGAWNENLGDAVVTYISLALVYILTFVPMVAYKVVAERIDIFYWLLLAYGAFVFPMLVLSVIQFHFSAAWNPVKIFRRISRTFTRYVPLCFGWYIFLVALHFIPSGLHIVISIAVQFAMLYIFMIFAHLIGRLYYNNKKRLDWF